MRGPLGDAEDRGLVEQRVEDATGAEPLLQPVGDVVDAALAPDVLAEQDHLGPPSQLIGEGGVQASGQRPGGRDEGVLGQRPAMQLEPRAGSSSGLAARATMRAGWYGAIGATTSSVVSSRGRRVASSAAAMTRSRVSASIACS